MNNLRRWSTAISLLFAAILPTRATTRYVDVHSATPSAPYLTWSTAATNIQDAIDAASPGDTVLVTNGVYQTGGHQVSPSVLINRAAITNAITVQSVNGPAVTSIVGNPVFGQSAVRAVFLANGAQLIGFTLTNGATSTDGDQFQEQSGGGAWCESTNAVLSNCVITGNRANYYGGGVFSGTLFRCAIQNNDATGGAACDSVLNDCVIAANTGTYGAGIFSCIANGCFLTGNSVFFFGGGAYQSSLNNCTVVSNVCDTFFGSRDYGGGGAFACTLYNSIVYSNYDINGSTNYDPTCLLNYCCTQPNPSAGIGNITADPLFADVPHLLPNSPCIAAGSTPYAGGKDIDGETWLNPPAIGCDEYVPGGVTGSINLTISASTNQAVTNIPVGFAGGITGRYYKYVWSVDGLQRATNLLTFSNAWPAPGDYSVVLSAYNDTYPGGASITNVVHVIAAATHYVNASGTSPVPPYAGWNTASTTIQDAVDAAAPGDIILVTNGVYGTGGRTTPSYNLTNRVIAPFPIQLRSVNGAGQTFIVGNATNDYTAARCVSLADGSTIVGFTLTNGGTLFGANPTFEQSGGGLFCYSTNVIVSNCVFAGNQAVASGSGGGIYNGTAYNCIFVGNSASYAGSAASGSLVFNSVAYGNGGSGAFWQSSLFNCTVLSNNDFGVGNCQVFNSIVMSNSPGNNYNSSLVNSCCTPLPPGPGNISADPQIVDLFHLGGFSPCRGAGNPAYAIGTDLDGEPWLNPPSIGCDEFYGLGPLSVSISASYTNVTTNILVNFSSQTSGSFTAVSWDFGDGTILSNQPTAVHSWASVGTYPVVFTAYNLDHPGGVSTVINLIIVPRPVHFVNLSNAMPVAPFTNWATAATNIQDAIDISSPGDLVLVTDGVYQTGGRLYSTNYLTNRVVLDKAVAVQSVNGPLATMIVGSRSVPIRCVCLADGAFLSGFTLANGATFPPNSYPTNDTLGGGVWGVTANAVISNCIIAGNEAVVGSGAYGGTLYDCVLSGNNSYSSGIGGGACSNFLCRCTISSNTAYTGGGIYDSIASNCFIWGNISTLGNGGGGAYAGALFSCILSNNTSSNYGGGSCYSILSNCVVANNSAPYNPAPFGAIGGGCIGGVLYNCLVSNNYTAGAGGGTYTSTVINSVLTANTSLLGGSGASGGVLSNSLIISNTLPVSSVTIFSSGAAVNSATLYNCTVTRNTSATNVAAGGIYHCTAYNSIIVSNTIVGAPNVANFTGGTFSYCCTAPLPAGPGNIALDPQLTDSFHLGPASPCRGAGNGLYAGRTDLDGEPWLNPPSIGCDEFYGRGILTDLVAAPLTNIATGFPLTVAGTANGSVTATRLDFGDGTIISNSFAAQHIWTSAGDFSVVFTAYNLDNPDGVSATLTIHVSTQPIVYVAAGNANPLPPYSSWAAAATNIQDAVDVATLPGALVLVSNGLYNSGGRVMSPYSLTNRVVVTNPIIVTSLNGPAVTVIQGVQISGATNGDGAARCVWLGDGAILRGFTLSSGATRAAGDSTNEESGGGAFCATVNAVLSNCVVLNNSSYFSGGGVVSGTLYNCALISNSVLTPLASLGGGAMLSTLKDCLLIGNYSAFVGGGAYRGSLYNCTVATNFAVNSAGGAYFSSVTNSILYYNRANTSANYQSGTFSYCCTTPLPAGPGNISALPAFADPINGDFHLQPTSPCINAGNNAYLTNNPIDLDGNPRVSGGTVDIGAYEFQNPLSTLSYAWLQQYGLPIDGSADNIDSDGDGMSNYAEWRAGTNPTNAASVLQLASPTNSGSNLIVTWQSVTNISYYLQRSPNLAPGSFQLLATNLPGRSGTTSYTNTNAVPGPWYYRIGVQ